MENKRRRFIRRVIFFISILLLLTQIIFIRFWYYKTLDDTGINAMMISQIVAQGINIDEYDKLLSTKEHNEYFEKMQEYFLSIQNETGVKYVYVEHKISSDKIEYIFDSEKDSLGEIDEISTPEAHTDKNSFHTKAQTSDLWGTLITGYAPLINEKGEVVGTVGTDVDINFIYNELEERVGQIILYTLAMVLLFSFLIYFVLNEEIRRRRIVEKDLNKSMLSIKNLLNNAGQGFLSFGSDLLIESEYSKECQRLLSPDLDKCSFPSLIYPNNQEQRDFMQKVLLECFQEKDIERREVFLSFLPKDIFVNNFYLEIEYKFISSNHQEKQEELMIILTDITEKRFLQEQMELERRTLKMIVKAVTNRNDLLELISDYRYLCEETVPNLFICQEPFNIVLTEIKRIVHTFKGMFGQFEMYHVVNALHEIEESIKTFEHQEDAGNAGLGMLLKNAKLALVLNDDLSIIHLTLGENFLSKDKIIEIPESQLIELEKQVIAHFASEDTAALITKLRQLRYRLFRELLVSYPNFVEGLAQKLEKRVYPLVLIGGDFSVDTEKYQAFAKTLIHIFTNCLDHGIENGEDRIEAGKDECGRIICEMKQEGNKIILRIADDGRGLDIEKIKQKALELGLYNKEEIAKLEYKDIAALVFEDGISGKDSVSIFSGRGIGMGVVKQELEEINGQMKIISVPGIGTEFIFILPAL